MCTSIATVSLSGDLDEKLAVIAAAGFAGVEILESDFLSFDGTPLDVGRMIADLGLKCVAFQPFRDFEGMPEPQRSRAFARAERKFDVMADLKAHDVLYDRDEAGENFQIYTGTFAERFFFEVAERRDYRGFGAVNAPIRLAAQTRGAAQAVLTGFGEEP